MATTVLDQLVTIFGFKADTKDLDKINQKIKNIQGSINKVAKGFAIAGAALTGVGVAVVKASLSYEEAINDLRVFTDLTEKSIDSLKIQARELGKGGRFGAKEVLAGQRALFQGQFSVNEVLGEMEHIVNSATASLVPLDQRAQEVVTILKQWKLEASDTQDVTDLLGAASKQAGFDIKVLPRTLGTIAPLAHQVGLSLQGAITEIVTLGEQAGGGSRGFQSAASAIEILLRELTELEEGSPGDLLLRQLQIDPSEIGKSVQLKDIFESLKGASDDVLREVFGPEYISDVLLRTSPEAIARAEQLQDVLSDVMGTAKQMAEERNMGLPGAWADFTSALTDVQIALGESGVSQAAGWLLTKLRELLSLISKAPGPLKAFFGAIINGGPVLLGAAAGLRILSWIIGKRLTAAILSRVIPALSTFWLRLQRAGLAAVNFGRNLLISGVEALKGLVTNLARASLGMLHFALKAIVAGISAVITFGVAIWASMIPPLIAATAAVVGFTLALLANPVVLIVAAIIGAFVALGFVVYKFRRQILGALKTVWGWIKGNWPLLVGILLGPFGIVGALIWKFKDDIIGAFAAVRDFIIGAWQAVVDFIMDKFNMVKELPGKLLEAIPRGGLIRQAAGLLGFAEGGIVPGPLGRPLLATVHGGEMVLPVGASRVIAQMLEGFRLGPAALPQAPHYYGQMYRSLVTNRTVNINITEPIVIHTQATDAQGIAQQLAQDIEDQIRNVAYDHDGPVER